MHEGDRVFGAESPFGGVSFTVAQSAASQT